MGFRFSTLADAMREPFARNAVLTFDDGYVDNMTVAKPILDEFGIPASVFVVTGDVGRRNLVWEEAGEKLPANLMTWDMLGKLAEDGWEIGSHAHEHIHLDRCSPDRQQETIERSAVDIEKRLGRRPASFCYPYGAFNDDTKKAVRTAGIQFALTSRRARSSQMSDLDHLELDRVIVGGKNADWYFKCAFRSLRALEPRPLILPTWNDPLISLGLSPNEN